MPKLNLIRTARLRAETIRTHAEQFRLTLETLKPSNNERLIPYDLLPEPQFMLSDSKSLERFLRDNDLQFALDALQTAQRERQRVS